MSRSTAKARGWVQPRLQGGALVRAGTSIVQALSVELIVIGHGSDVHD